MGFIVRNTWAVHETWSGLFPEDLDGWIMEGRYVVSRVVSLVKRQKQIYMELLLYRRRNAGAGFYTHTGGADWGRCRPRPGDEDLE